MCFVGQNLVYNFVWIYYTQHLTKRVYLRIVNENISHFKVAFHKMSGDIYLNVPYKNENKYLYMLFFIFIIGQKISAPCGILTFSC